MLILFYNLLVFDKDYYEQFVTDFIDNIDNDLFLKCLGLKVS